MRFLHTKSTLAPRKSTSLSKLSQIPVRRALGDITSPNAPSAALTSQSKPKQKENTQKAAFSVYKEGPPTAQKSDHAQKPRKLTKRSPKRDHDLPQAQEASPVATRQNPPNNVEKGPSSVVLSSTESATQLWHPTPIRVFSEPTFVDQPKEEEAPSEDIIRYGPYKGYRPSEVQALARSFLNFRQGGDLQLSASEGHTGPAPSGEETPSWLDEESAFADDEDEDLNAGYFDHSEHDDVSLIRLAL